MLSPLSVFMLFFSGMMLLLFSSYTLVRMASLIASAARIPPFAIGLTVIAIGTSLPEVVVSTLAIFRGDFGLAEGNVIGSNISNILLVLPAGILAGKLAIGRHDAQRNIAVFALATLAFVLMAWMVPAPLLGVALLIGAAVYTLLQYLWGTQSIAASRAHSHDRVTSKTLLYLLMSIAGLTISGALVVHSVEQLANITGNSTSVFGLSLTAIATSLPELFTTVFSQRNKDNELALGNIVGSNIYNSFFIGGLIGLFAGFESITYEYWGFFVVSSIALLSIVFFFRGKVVHKLNAYLLLAGFAAYLYHLHIRI